MRRRLITLVVGTAVVATTLAGAGTLALVALSARRAALSEATEQAESLAAVVPRLVTDAGGPGSADRRLAVLRLLNRPLGAVDVGVVGLTPAGRVVGSPPEGVTLDPGTVAGLREGRVVTGGTDGRVWAAAPAAGRLAVVVVRDVRVGDPRVVGFFVASGLVVVAGSAVVALRLADRIVGPLRQTVAATGRLAAGDLSVRVDPPGGDDEVAELARSVNTLAGALERSRGVQRQFLMSVSHDLRTPLTAIRGYAEALEDGAADPGAAGRVIAEQAARLQRLVEDLLLLSRLEAGGFPMRPADVDAADVVAAAVEAAAPAAAERGVRVVTDLGPGPVRVDPDRLGQVVSNLLSNAVRYARSRVWVEVSDADGAVRITVTDDGPGIDEEDLPRVFDRLFVARRSPDGDSPGGGTGLGLAIVRELVEAMGGRVTAARGTGGGARLEVLLPRR